MRTHRHRIGRAGLFMASSLPTGARRWVQSPGDTTAADRTANLKIVEAERAASRLTFRRDHASPTGVWSDIDTSFVDIATDVGADYPTEHVTNALSELWDEALAASPDELTEQDEGSSRADDLQALLSAAATVAPASSKLDLARQLNSELISFLTMERTPVVMSSVTETHSGPNYENAPQLLNSRRRFFAARQLFLDSKPLLFPAVESAARVDTSPALAFELARLVQLMEAAVVFRASSRPFAPMSWDSRPQRDFEPVDMRGPVESSLWQLGRHFSALLASPPRTTVNTSRDDVKKGSNKHAALVNSLVGVQAVARRTGACLESFSVSTVGDTAQQANFFAALQQTLAAIGNVDPAVCAGLAQSFPRGNASIGAVVAADFNDALAAWSRHVIAAIPSMLMEHVAVVLTFACDIFAHHGTEAMSPPLAPLRPEVAAALGGVVERALATLRRILELDGDEPVEAFYARSGIDPLKRVLKTIDAYRGVGEERRDDTGIPSINHMVMEGARPIVFTTRAAAVGSRALGKLQRVVPAEQRWCLKAAPAVQSKILKWIAKPTTQARLGHSVEEATQVLGSLAAMAPPARAGSRLRAAVERVASLHEKDAHVDEALKAGDNAVGDQISAADVSHIVTALDAFTEFGYRPRCLGAIRTHLLRFGAERFTLYDVEVCARAFAVLGPEVGRSWLASMAPRVEALIAAVAVTDLEGLDLVARVAVAYSMAAPHGHAVVLAVAARVLVEAGGKSWPQEGGEHEAPRLLFAVGAAEVLRCALETKNGDVDIPALAGAVAAAAPSPSDLPASVAAGVLLAALRSDTVPATPLLDHCLRAVCTDANQVPLGTALSVAGALVVMAPSAAAVSSEQVDVVVANVASRLGSAGLELLEVANDVLRAIAPATEASPRAASLADACARFCLRNVLLFDEANASRRERPTGSVDSSSFDLDGLGNAVRDKVRHESHVETARELLGSPALRHRVEAVFDAVLDEVELFVEGSAATNAAA